jgi:hypothetical protein
MLFQLTDGGYLQYSVGDIAPQHTAQVPNGLLCPKAGMKHDYFIVISATNGEVAENFHLMPKGDGWQQSGVVSRADKNGQKMVIKTF